MSSALQALSLILILDCVDPPAESTKYTVLPSKSAFVRVGIILSEMRAVNAQLTLFTTKPEGSAVLLAYKMRSTVSPLGSVSVNLVITSSEVSASNAQPIKYMTNQPNYAEIHAKQMKSTVPLSKNASADQDII